MFEVFVMVRLFTEVLVKTSSVTELHFLIVRLGKNDKTVVPSEDGAFFAVILTPSCSSHACVLDEFHKSILAVMLVKRIESLEGRNCNDPRYVASKESDISFVILERARVPAEGRAKGRHSDGHSSSPIEQ